MINCYAFDIDGTLADTRHRLHYLQKSPKDWDGWYRDCRFDEAYPHILTLAQSLQHWSPLVFVSARREEVRVVTEGWLRSRSLYGRVYMRPHDDRRDDYLVKLNMIRDLLQDGYNPQMAFDDRDRSVAAWRSLGIPCAQVAAGNF